MKQIDFRLNDLLHVATNIDFDFGILLVHKFLIIIMNVYCQNVMTFLNLFVGTVDAHKYEQVIAVRDYA